MKAAKTNDIDKEKILEWESSKISRKIQKKIVI